MLRKTAELSADIRSALLVTVLEFCSVAKKVGAAEVILGKMDLSDEAFEETLGLLERLLE
ncbi:MAG: hypothetical protein ACPLPR_08575 [Bacillota bacterium]